MKLRDIFEILSMFGREVKLFPAIGMTLLVLNLIFSKPLLGVYSTISVITALVLLIVDKVKGPTLTFGPDERFKAYTCVVK